MRYVFEFLIVAAVVVLILKFGWTLVSESVWLWLGEAQNRRARGEVLRKEARARARADE